MQSAVPRESLEHSYECNVRGGAAAASLSGTAPRAASPGAPARYCERRARSFGMDPRARFLVREDEDEIVIKSI